MFTTSSTSRFTRCWPLTTIEIPGLRVFLLLPNGLGSSNPVTSPALRVRPSVTWCLLPLCTSLYLGPSPVSSITFTVFFISSRSWGRKSERDRGREVRSSQRVNDFEGLRSPVPSDFLRGTLCPVPFLPLSSLLFGSNFLYHVTSYYSWCLFSCALYIPSTLTILPPLVTPVPSGVSL